MANECAPLFRPGQSVTATATANVTGKRFVGVSATRDATTGLIKVAHATQAGKAFGVASRDIANGADGTILRGGIVPVEAGGNVSAGNQVEVGANGTAVALSSGVAVGTAVEDGTSGNDIFVALDL